MPIKRVKIGSKYFYKWGEHGKLYPTKEQALKQGRAIKAQEEES